MRTVCRKTCFDCGNRLYHFYISSLPEISVKMPLANKKARLHRNKEKGFCWCRSKEKFFRTFFLITAYKRMAEECARENKEKVAGTEEVSAQIFLLISELIRFSENIRLLSLSVASNHLEMSYFNDISTNDNDFFKQFKLNFYATTGKEDSLCCYFFFSLKMQLFLLQLLKRGSRIRYE